MFNLLIGLKDNIAYGSRFLEYTDDSTKERLEKNVVPTSRSPCYI